MQKNLKLWNRRSVLKWGVGLGGLLVASTLFGKNFSSAHRYYEQGLGPFFPDPGDPVDPIRESGDENVSIIEANDWDLTRVQGKTGHAKGQVVYLQGNVLSSTGAPLAGSTLLLWQASATGRYNHRGDTAFTEFQDPRGKTITRTLDPSFQYWGHAVTDAEGRYRFKTIIPGYYPADFKSGWFRPPHLHFIAQADGHRELVTQTYFEGDAIRDNAYIQKLNARDYLLRDPDLSRKQQERLIVHYQKDATQPDGLVGNFDFILPKV